MKLKNLFTIVLFLMTMSLYGQDTIYLDQYGDKTKLKANEVTYRLTSPDSAVSEGKIEREYYLSGKIKSECHLIPVLDEKTKKQRTVWNGKYKMWYESGQLQRDIDYQNYKIDGNLTTYWENGKIKRHDLYKEDNPVNGKCFDNNGQEVAYYPFHKMPLFRSGEKELMTFIARSLKYPIDAQEAGIQGKVIVHFIIDKEGEIQNIQLTRSLFPSIDNEALRVVSILPRWIPGEKDGEKASESYILPVSFHLNRSVNNLPAGFYRSTF